MASPWPSTLPQNQFVGMTEQRAVATIRSNMETGPAKQRPRYTAAVRTFSIPVKLNGTQRQTFDTFFITTLQNGAVSFTWTDPVTDAGVTMRFTAPPQWKLDAGGTTATRVWETTMQLEILP